MGEVYSKTTNVVVWLGPDEEGDGQFAIEAINLIALFISTYRTFLDDMRQ